MSLAVLKSRALLGMSAPLVTVVVHLANGLPSFNIVGLPEAEVKESKDRVRAAIKNTGLSFPVSRLTINLAPADLPKEGARLDLPIAIGILAASSQLEPEVLSGFEFIGELALNGELRQVTGSLAVARAIKAEDLARKKLASHTVSSEQLSKQSSESKPPQLIASSQVPLHRLSP